MYFRSSAIKDKINRHIGSNNLPAALEAEPGNEHDPYAVKLGVQFPDGSIEHVGYVPAIYSGLVYRWLEGGNDGDTCYVNIVADSKTKVGVPLIYLDTEAQ
jgi:hypothetical protein